MVMRHSVLISIVATAVVIGPGARCAPASSSEKPTTDAKQSEAKKSEHSDKKAGETGEGEKSPSADTHGVELGKFSVRMHRNVPSQTNRVSFTLFATVQPDESKHLEHLLESRQNKARDQVIVATRLVPAEEYDDAELKQFRRRILLRLRRTMPELMITDIYVSDFNLVVESD